MPKSLFLLTLISLSTLSTRAEEFTIKTLTAQMKYDTTELQVQPGAAVTLHFENGDDLPHNLCLCDPGTDVVAMALKQLEKPEEALKRNWVPDDKRIWAHSKLLNPHEKETLTFTAPTKPGKYPYVCTFPGHAMTMQGELRVYPQGEGLKDLKFALYLGDWKQLPDFRSLTPHREGSVPDNLVQIKLDDYKNQFGVVFTGRLNAPKDGSYAFFISSDDGGRVLIDGQEVVSYDGIHPAGEIKSKSIKLKKGEHEYRLEYFQAAGEINLFAAWKGADFDITPLSTWLHPAWKGGGKKKKDETTGMPLVVANEALVYRNFITGAGNRGIGVGYPGGFNIAWSAESMNLALIWRGAFIDAARHWTSRGGGAQPPLGYDVLQPTGEVTPSLGFLPTPDAEWPKYKKDQRYEDFAWKGYRLDSERNPTFHYEWNGYAVEDRFSPEESTKERSGSLNRYVRFRKIGPHKPFAYLLLLAGDVAAGQLNSFVLKKKLVVGFMGTTDPVIRRVGGSKQVLFPVPDMDEGLYTFSYGWMP